MAVSEQTGNILFYLALLVLPISALVAQRIPIARAARMAAAWIGIFGIGLLLVGQRDRLAALVSDQQVEGRETRIRMAADGHFWANVEIDGVTRRMLIDSGATTTALSSATAAATGIDKRLGPFETIIATANGNVVARTASAHRVVVGNVATHDLDVVVAPAFGTTDVIGMNFLSRLGTWRVEGRTLVLSPRP